MSYVVAQLGARMHYGVPRILERAGLLERLYTDISVPPRAARVLEGVAKCAGLGHLRRLAGRRPIGIAPPRIKSFPELAMRYWLRQKMAGSAEHTTEAHLWVGRRFAASVVRHGLGRASGVYTYNSAALEILRAAREAGLRCVVEQTMAPWACMRAIMRREEESFPSWRAEGDDGTAASRFAAREAEEWAMADAIVCGSSFVQDGIASLGGPGDRCVIVPYGVDASFRLPPRRSHHGRLRVLTVGTVGLRKGMPYVLAAARRLRGLAEFRVVGPLDVSDDVAAELAAALELTGPVPRADVLRHLAWADVFLLPSLCEGSATVVYEAMAASLPVICTPNTGSVVRDGVDGLIVPTRDVDGIVGAVERLASGHDLRQAMAESAAARAADHDLEGYARRLLGALTPEQPVARLAA